MYELTDRELLSSFIKQCKRISANFSNEDIIHLHNLLQSQLNNTPKTDLFYNDILFALYITSNYIQFTSSLNLDNNTNSIKSTTPKLKQKLPQGWSVIK